MGLQVVRWMEGEEASPAQAVGSPPRALLTVERASALRQLRSELARRQAEWRVEEERVRCNTGWAEVDALLGGGFLKGTVSSLGGGLGAGATSLAARALARVIEQGELGAWVDRDGTLCAAGLAAQGVRLDRLLWVRPSAEDLVWTALQLARCGAFAFLVIDWPPSDSDVVTGQRLSDAARAGGCAVLLLPGATDAPAAFKARVEAGVSRPGLLHSVVDPEPSVKDLGWRRVRLWVERSRRGGETSGRVRLRPPGPVPRVLPWRALASLPPARTGPDVLWGSLPVRPLAGEVHLRPRSRFREGGQPVPRGRVDALLPEIPHGMPAEEEAS